MFKQVFGGGIEGTADLEEDVEKRSESYRNFVVDMN